MHHRRRLRNGARLPAYQNAIAIFIVLTALTQDHCYDGRASGRFSVAAFTPNNGKASKTNPIDSAVFDPMPATISDTNLLMASGNKNDENQEISPVFWEDLDKKPGNLIMLPFLALFGIDLLLNIVFMTKRSLVYFLTGEAPSTETWFSGS